MNKRVISETDIHRRRFMEILDRQCEKFLGGPTVPYAERIHATINPGGTMFINRKAHAMMGAPQAVYLYFNREKDMIIIEPTSATTSAAAFTLRETPPVTGRYIYANPFCKHFGIRPDTTLRFLAPETDAIGRLYLKLQETVAVPRPGHRKPRKRSQSK